MKLGTQGRTLRYLVTSGTTGTQDARGLEAHRDLRGPEDCRDSPEVQERKVRLFLLSIFEGDKYNTQKKCFVSTQLSTANNAQSVYL